MVNSYDSLLAFEQAAIALRGTHPALPQGGHTWTSRKGIGFLQLFGCCSAPQLCVQSCELKGNSVARS